MLVDQPLNRAIDRPSDRAIDVGVTQRPGDRTVDRPSDRSIDQRWTNRSSDPYNKYLSYELVGYREANRIDIFLFAQPVQSPGEQLSHGGGKFNMQPSNKITRHS